MKVQLPWIGKASGSSAGTIYQTYWGRTYSRSFPSSFHYPDTPSQQSAQAKFYDTMRIWLPIYQSISPLIGADQRHNVNCYNLYLKSIYRLLNPFEKGSNSRPPRYFGVDDLNRVIVRMADIYFVATKVNFELHFHYSDESISIADNFQRAHFLLANRTRQSLYYRWYWYTPYTTYQGFKNTNDWQADDEIYSYVALSGSHWLGNFNLSL